MQGTVLDQARLEVNEWLLRLDFKSSCAAVTTYCDRMNVTVPVQLSANNQRPCSRWVTNAERPLKSALGRLRHFIS